MDDSCDLLVALLQWICCPFGYGRTCCHCCDTKSQNDEDEQLVNKEAGVPEEGPPEGYRMVRTDF